MLVVVDSLRSHKGEQLSLDKTSPSVRKALEQFKQLLRYALRAELIIQPDQDEQALLGREASIFLDALNKG